MTLLTGAKKVVCLGDKNQIPYIDRDHVSDLKYTLPSSYMDVREELHASYWCPIDVMYVLSPMYSSLPIYTNNLLVRSMVWKRYSENFSGIRRDQDYTLYLVHNQSDKQQLVDNKYGVGKGSAVLTIHEAQGATYEHVICIKKNEKPLMIYDQVPWAIVAISRHTKSLVYYSDVEDLLYKYVTSVVVPDEVLITWNAMRRVNAKKAGYYESDVIFTRHIGRPLDEELVMDLPHATHEPLRERVVSECISFEGSKPIVM